jgi:hypothetical protein
MGLGEKCLMEEKLRMKPLWSRWRNPLTFYNPKGAIDDRDARQSPPDKGHAAGRTRSIK